MSIKTTITGDRFGLRNVSGKYRRNVQKALDKSAFAVRNRAIKIIRSTSPSRTGTINRRKGTRRGGQFQPPIDDLGVLARNIFATNTAIGLREIGVPESVASKKGFRYPKYLEEEARDPRRLRKFLKPALEQEESTIKRFMNEAGTNAFRTG